MAETDAPTLSQIAADLRRLAPETAPLAVWLGEDPDQIYTTEEERDQTDRLAIVGAMVLACPRGIQRGSMGCGPVWFAWRETQESQFFDDRDYDDDPLLSLHAAFLWAKGEA